MPLLKILSSSDIAGFDSPPVFNHEERKKFFSMPGGFKQFWRKLRTAENQTLFVLQLGYFRARQKFFAGHFYSDDFEFIKQKYGFSFSSDKQPVYSRPTIARHQLIILDFYSLRSIEKSDQEFLFDEAVSLARLVVRPDKIFWQMVDKIKTSKLVVPSYHLLAVTVSQAVRDNEQRLYAVINEHLTLEQKQLLDSLLENAAGENNESSPTLKSLKQPFHSLKASHIKANLNDWQFLQTIYQAVSPVVSKLGLHPEAARFYAQTVLKTDIFHNARRRDESRYLHLTAFVVFQTFRLQDMLVDSLLQTVQTTVNSATQEYREQYFQKRLEHKKMFHSLLESLQTNVFPTFNVISQTLRESLSPTEKLLLIESAVNEHLIERANLEQQVNSLAKENSDEQTEPEFYEILQRKSLALQRRASDIVRFLKVDEQNGNSELVAALRNFQNKNGTIEKNAPQDFLSAKEKQLLVGKSFPVSLYKALLFQKIAGGIKSGTLNFTNSNKYRSLEDYLIPAREWQNNRSFYLKKSALSSFENFLPLAAQLINITDEMFQNTNLGLSKNECFQFKETNSWTISTPKEDSELAKPLKDYFPKRSVVALSEILSTVEQAANLLADFTRLKTTAAHRRPPNYVFFAGIVALGCELGVAKVTYTSRQLGETELENTVNRYFTLDNLRSANRNLVEFLDRLEIPNLYRRTTGKLHTSSDGQKYEVSVPSLNANYSFKYFGQNKGVSVYSFIDERHLLFYSTVISSSEREAAYVIDGLLHNETIKSDIHSTDSHGFTEVVFAVTHLLGFTFAPRLKKLSKHRLYSFEKRKVYENQNFQILPKAYIDTKLIEENWDDILRFVATIKLKRTSASQLFKRLNSYSNQHPLYQALKEFGKIIKTLFILRYVDDPELRQSIEKQLNKIEHAQRFAKAIAFGNGQEVSQAEKEDQEITAECRRLIENSVICWNYLYLTHKLTKSGVGEKTELLKAIKEGSIITWRHVNFYGEYDFSEEKLKDSIGFNLPEIVGWKMVENREQDIPLKSIETDGYQKSYETFLPFGDF